jgi:hypothetical protein
MNRKNPLNEINRPEFRDGYRMGYSNTRSSQCGVANLIPKPRRADNPLFYRGFVAGRADAEAGVTDTMYRRFGRDKINAADWEDHALLPTCS